MNGKRFKQGKTENANCIKKCTKMKSKKRFVLMVAILIIAIIGITFASNSKKIMNSEFVQSIKQFLLGSSTNDGPRQKLNFNYDWEFSKGQGYNNKNSDLPQESVSIIPTNSEIKPYEANYTIDSNNVGLNEETWENVSLPHTYNDTDTFDNFEESGQNGERSMYTGTAWYKKTFTIPEEYKGKRIYIEFERARQASKVYLNGHLLEGTQENGFIAFGYDLTPYINYADSEIEGANGVNEITVMVDNTYGYKIEGTSSTIPWNDSHWHPTMGGLYGNSYLYVMDDLHLTLPLYSFIETEGTYIYTSNETATTAKIHVNAQIENSSSQEKTFTYVAEVRDADGNTVLTMQSENQILQAGEKKIFLLADTLQNAKRWSVDYPYLYNVVCKVLVNGKVVDNNQNELGIRTVRFTTDAGMYLNENYTVLNGWGQKPTNEWAGLGSAYPDWMQDYVVKMMKDAGGNYIRYGHTAGGEAQIDAANRYGVLILQPGVDSEGSYGGAYNTAAYKLRENAFRDMIIYFRNNPSIVMWELGNQSNITEESMKNLNDIVQNYDYGNRAETISSSILSQTCVNDSSELVGEEIITNAGSYASTTSQSDRLIALRQGNSTASKYVEIEESTDGGSINMGGKPVIEGEYNRLEARRGVWDYSTKGYENFVNNTTDSGYQYVTSEEFAVSQATKYATLINNSRMNGVANWIFSDSTSHGRVKSEVARASGEVDAVMLPKESYWVCQTLFKNQNGIHIIGHWNYETGTTKKIYVVAKGAASVELKINGVSKGVNSEPTSTYLYTFNDIEFEPGTVEAIAKDIDGQIIATDTMKTDGTPTKLKITPITSEDGLLANGSDVLLLDVEVVDENGNRCESFDGIRDNILTNFTINDENGCSIWRGGYNSSIEGSTNNKYLYIESGITRVAVRTTMKPGTITVTATTNGLESASVTVNSSAVDNSNGYSKTLSSKLTYSLDDLEYQEYGNGSNRGENLETTNENKSELISNLNYTGEGTTAQIAEPFGKDKIVYADSQDRFESIPYEMQNGEYILLNSTNNGDVAADLINFVALKNIEVFILRDPKVKSPEWLIEYTKQEDIVTTTEGMIYYVYKKAFNTGDLITIGGNAEDGIDGKEGRMNVVAIKDTYRIENNLFHQETFDNENMDNCWVRDIGKNTNIETVKDGENNVAKLTDTANGTIAYMYTEFAKQEDKYSVSYRLNISSSVDTNKYIRAFVAQGVIQHPTVETKSNLLIEAYLDGSTKKVSIRSDGSTSGQDVGIIPSLDEWHTYEYVVNTKTHTYDLKIDGNTVRTAIKFFQTSLNYADKFIIGTGNNSSNNFMFDDFKVTPIARQGITNIKVNDNEIVTFNPLTQSYKVEGDTTEIQQNTIEIEQGTTYASHTVTYFDNYATINITDTENVTTTYKVYFVEPEAYKNVNKTELRSLISKVEGLNSVYYTSVTWEELQNAKNNAKIVEGKEKPTQASVNNAVTLLKQKLQQLVLIN